MKRLAAAAIVLGALVVGMPVAAQAPAQRRVTIVVDISHPADREPLLRADGRPSPDADATVGVLRERVARLDDDEAPPFALKLSAVLCEQLRLLDTPRARGLLADIARVAADHPALVVPHTDVRFGDVGPDSFADELDDGRRAVTACTKRQPLDLLATSDLGVPDDRDLRRLAKDGPTYLLSGYAFPPRPGDDPPPYAIAAIASSEPVDGNAALAARPGAGHIAVVVDLHWAPATFEALGSDARIGLEPAGALLDPANDFPQGLVYEPEPIGSRTTRALRGAREALDDLRSYTLPDNTYVRTLGTIVAEVSATANARVRNSAAAVRRADAVEQEIRRQFALVSLSDGSVTFTSRRGSVPVTVSNRAAYTVKVRVSLQSPKLTFPQTRTLVREVAPPGRTFTFEALARSSGTFPLSAVLKSPSGAVTLDTAEFTVRSTAANLPVVILTVAGALIMLVLYVGRVGRRRRAT